MNALGLSDYLLLAAVVASTVYLSIVTLAVAHAVAKFIIGIGTRAVRGAWLRRRSEVPAARVSA
jgi:hypothetical protein